MTGYPLGTMFAAGAERPFLEEDGRIWSVNRLLALSRDVVAAVPADAGEMIGVRSRSAAFITASLLGLATVRRCALLVDPALQGEPAGLRGGGGLPILVWEGEGGGNPADFVVRESGGEPLAPRLPEDADLLVAFLTSGSTGEPKVISKRTFQFARQFEVELDRLGLSGPIKVLSLVPAFHILGFVYGVYDAAANGGRAIFSVGSPPQEWERLMRSEQPDLVVGIPSHYRILNQVAGRPLPSAVYLSSGAPLPPEVADEFELRNGQPIVQVYGSTETGGVASRTGAGPWRPLPGLQWTTDTEARLRVFSSWQERPEAWFATDDLASPYDDGFRLLGRADSILKIAGKRFSIQEVVQSALEMPEIDQAAAVTYLRYGEPAVALFVTARGAASLDAGAVREFLARRLAPFKLPRTLQVVKSLPSRGIGKVDAEALRRIAEA